MRTSMIIRECASNKTREQRSFTAKNKEHSPHKLRIHSKLAMQCNAFGRVLDCLVLLLSTLAFVIKARCPKQGLSTA
eukprot:534455-Amphidinium_carterae.1